MCPTSNCRRHGWMDKCLLGITPPDAARCKRNCPGSSVAEPPVPGSPMAERSVAGGAVFAQRSGATTLGARVYAGSPSRGCSAEPRKPRHPARSVSRAMLFGARSVWLSLSPLRGSCERRRIPGVPCGHPRLNPVGPSGLRIKTMLFAAPKGRQDLAGGVAKRNPRYPGSPFV